MKILVTGASGMLGNDFCEIVARQHDVIASDIDSLDVAVERNVSESLDRHLPDVVAHLAAWTDVDGCEKDPDKAYRVNTIGTRNVALACKKLNIPLLYISTIAVFDGTKFEPYTEHDRPNPQSVYSRSKYEGELQIQAVMNRYFIVRTGWLFGGRHRDSKFVAKMLKQARETDKLSVVDDKYGSPTYTLDLARCLAQLIATERYGVYHIVNAGNAPSRFEVAQRIFDYAGIRHCHLRAVPSSDFQLPAPRPRMEAAYSSSLGGIVNEMRPWTEALQEYIAEVDAG